MPVWPGLLGVTIAIKTNKIIVIILSKSTEIAILKCANLKDRQNQTRSFRTPMFLLDPQVKRHAKRPFILVSICVKYGNNPPRCLCVYVCVWSGHDEIWHILEVLSQIHGWTTMKNMSRSKIFACCTTCHANDYLCKIWMNPFRTVRAAERT